LEAKNAKLKRMVAEREMVIETPKVRVSLRRAGYVMEPQRAYRLWRSAAPNMKEV